MVDLILRPSDEQRYVWTFIVRGGQAFQLRAGHHPVLDHPGSGVTIWKMIGTREQSDEAFKILTGFGGDVERLVEEQTPDLIASRLREDEP